MHTFGWTIEYTLGLSWPVFFDLTALIRRVRYDNAIDSVFMPYGAAKYGKSFASDLFEGRGGYYLTPEEDLPKSDYTEADLKRAERKLRRIIREREKKLAEAASENRA